MASEFTLEQFKLVITPLYGSIGDIAAHFGVSRQSVCDFLEQHPGLPPLMDDARLNALDRVNKCAIDAALNGNTVMQKLIMETKLGYSNKNVPGENDKPPVALNFNFGEMGLAELMESKNKLQNKLSEGEG